MKSRRTPCSEPNSNVARVLLFKDTGLKLQSRLAFLSASHHPTCDLPPLLGQYARVDLQDLAPLRPIPLRDVTGIRRVAVDYEGHLKNTAQGLRAGLEQFESRTVAHIQQTIDLRQMDVEQLRKLRLVNVNLGDRGGVVLHGPSGA